MGEIEWTEKASANLQAIHEYISKDSKVYATRFVKSLVTATSKLKDMPFCGRIVPELESLGLREVVYRNYRIVYRLRGDDVQILAVVHASREFMNAVKPEWQL